MSARIEEQFVERYITAGSVTAILISNDSGSHYSFHINEWKKVPGMFFVEYKGETTQKVGYFKKGTGHNHDHWNFVINGSLFATDKPVLAFSYMLDCINNKRSFGALEVWHDGRCGRCHRQLTDPVSIETGFGPECIKIIMKL
jgi:hypothetical protein